MTKTIILPTDFSDNARNAYHYAFSMFGFENVRYIIVNTFEVSYSRGDILINLQDILSKNSISGLEGELEYIKSKYEGAEESIELISIFGDVTATLNELIENEKADLIVMGTKGASGIEKVFIGSNAAKVIRKVNCPTIAVPTEARFTKPKKIGFATDYEKLQHRSIKPLFEIAKKFDAKLLIFNIETEGSSEEFKSSTTETYSHPSLEGIDQSFTVIQEDDIIEGIEDFVDDYDVDLLAMVAQQHNFFERIFHRSITKQMAMNMEEIPLLVMHEYD